MEDFPAIHHDQQLFRFRIQDITAQLHNLHHVHNQSRSSVQPVQFHVKLVHQSQYKYINHSLNTETTVIEFTKTKTANRRFDMDMLKNYCEAHLILSSMLEIVGINRRDAFSIHIVEQIIEQGLLIGSRVSNVGHKVLGLCVHMKKVHLKHRYEPCMQLIERILMSNGINEGMVPASDSAIEKVLKRVRVGDGDEEEEEGRRERKRRQICASESDSCTVCMEEFNGGSEIACMPCSHLFHEKCIVTWLKQSHYCPVCRFEVPTDG
ncbi:hypothetical protein PRUPE_2G025300 [Prunus persica]|uniref:RING-type E3 ubiquitin transferase n=1 Tax=Prunus persica TaxID=3760 RepID=A0A251Q9Y5_PRUPE|nr:hypothetical protein PRUPE_2G025300 [Prunus persica]